MSTQHKKTRSSGAAAASEAGIPFERVARNRRRLALVTGGNRGLGLETAKQLAEQGVDVLLGSRDFEKGLLAVKRIDNGASAITPIRLDVTNPADIAALADRLQREHGRLDILINNAGLGYDESAYAQSADVERVRADFDTNFFGAWRLVHAVLPFMRKHGYGRIVNVSSGCGSLATAGCAAAGYRTAKAALNALTRILAVELSGTGILVNAVCPGWVATDMGGEGGRPVAAGAAGIVWAALLEEAGPTGGFFRDRTLLPW